MLKYTYQQLLNQIGAHPALTRDNPVGRNQARRLVVDRVTVPIQGLHPALDGFTIVQLSDIHLRPFTQLDHVQRAVRLTNALHPDLVVLTGDYVWHDASDIEDLAPALGRLNARQGVFAILGNHDVWTNPDLITRWLERQGIPVLHNRGVVLQAGRGRLHLAGVDDGWSGRPNLAAALSRASADAPTVLLAHEPDLIDAYSRDARIALQLSGHTHGGQVKLRNNRPLVAPYLGRKYIAGLYRVGRSWLYTSRGIGVTGVPLRLNCPPEITYITLTAERPQLS